MNTPDVESKQVKASNLSSPLAIAIATGLIGILATGAGALIQSRANLELERQKFESELILKAIGTGDQRTAANNLLFFRQLGLIRDPNGKIDQLARAHDSTIPVLPLPITSSPLFGATVPSVIGLTLARARQTLLNSGLQMLDSGSTQNPNAIIIQQMPAPGARVTPGAAVRVSVGPPQ